MNRVFYDADNSLELGPVSGGVIHNAHNGKFPVINFYDIEDYILGQEPPRKFRSLIGKIKKSITYLPFLRPVRESAKEPVKQIAEITGEASNYLLSGRIEELLGITEATLAAGGVLKHLQGGILLKPKGLGSAEWKANVLYYFATEYPDEQIYLIDNDLISSIAIGESLLDMGIENVTILLREGFETTKLVFEYAKVEGWPRNLKFFKTFADLPAMIIPELEG